MEQQPKLNLSSTSHNLDRSSLQPTFLWTREYSGGNVVASNAVFLEGAPPEPTMFERLLHSVARKVQKKENVDELKVRQWHEDDKNVREGNCSFQVQYLGSVEVPQSKGVQLCEEVVKNLKHTQTRTAKKSDEHSDNGWATMYISSEKISVVDDDSQTVLVEDSIKSISFCSAHRRHDKCFAYISRLSATEHRWMCHAFSAITATGERLNHAVGCAFEACRQSKSQSGNNRPQEEKRTDTATTSAAAHHEPAKHHTITTDVSKLPDPSIARPRPSIDGQRSQVTLEMNVME